MTQVDIKTASLIPFHHHLAAVLLFGFFNYLIALYVKALGFVDITWSLMFLLPNFLIYFERKSEMNEVMLLNLVLVTVWALRLSLHLFRRFHGEDYRYVIIAKRWQHYGPVGRFIYAYLFVFAMQALFSLVNNASAMHVMKYSTRDQKIGPVEIAGATIWAIGFLCETIGDA